MKRNLGKLAGGALCMLLLSQCGESTDNPPVNGGDPVFTPVFSSTGAEVRDFIAKGSGGARAKLVYVDRTRATATLNFLDFSEAAGAQPPIHVIALAKDAEVPVISPDGNWVVYATGNGAEAGSPTSARSSVYLVKLEENAQPVLVARDSACEPRFVQDPPAGKLAVVYPTLCPNAAWEGFGRTLEVEVDVSGPDPVVGAPKVLRDDGSYTGGLSWDRKYLCGGGTHVAMVELNGAKARPDTLSFHMVQSCNASISSSRNATNTLMYLNFPKDSTPFVDGGKVWGEWQTILISNSKQQFVKGFTYPRTFAFDPETNPKSFTRAKWHHPEWSNHPYFAAATVNMNRYFQTDNGFANTDFQERLYLLNLKDSTYLEVLRPETVKYTGKSLGGFYWPWLWVEVPAAFEEAPGWLASPEQP